MPRLTIRWRMILLVAGPTLVIYLVVLGLTMGQLNRENRRAIERDMTRLAQNYAARFDGYLQQAATIADITSSAVELRPEISEREIFQQLRANVNERPFIYGAAMAFEPGTFKDDDSLFCPYVHRDGMALREMNIDRSVYDWHGDPQWEWFQAPKNSGAPVWTDPYFDEGAGDVLMVTYSVPFNGNGSFRGVTTVDIEIPRLNETVGKHIVGDHRFYVISDSGIMVYSSFGEQIGRSLGELASEADRADLEHVANRIASGEVGVEHFAGVEGVDPPGSRRWAFFAPIESSGWGFAVDMYEREVFADVRRRMVIASAALALTLVLIIGAIVFVAGRLTRPIVRLRERVADISGGDLDARVEGVDSNDEIGDLAQAFNKMTDDLRGMIDRLAAEQTARAKIERDLDLARQIQQGLMPNVDPRTPGFAISGWNNPADKTGGDYYDWLELPDGKTIVTLADVTGHGIGPALIVAVCRAYMRASMTSEEAFEEGLARVNDLLHEDVPVGKFITAAVAVVDPSQGTLRVSSAGQGPLLFFEASSGLLHTFDTDHPPLAVVGSTSFPQARTLSCETGDTLVMTTDGFFEWANAQGELFGVRRLEAFVRENHRLEPDALIQALHEAVLDFSGGTEQADDLTAVVIKKL